MLIEYLGCFKKMFIYYGRVFWIVVISWFLKVNYLINICIVIKIDFICVFECKKKIMIFFFLNILWNFMYI